MDMKELTRLAVSARERAYAPYSGYRVGAALLAEDGTVYLGCNIENAAFSPTVCAERVALFKAVSEGKRRFTALAVAGGGDKVSLTTPCGVCRQALSEFCAPDMTVALAEDGEGAHTETTLGALLPGAFGADFMGGK